MTLVLDATPGGASSNSYCLRVEGDAYHEGHFYAQPWTSLTNPQKETCLVWATRLLDEHVSWHGTKTTRGQALRWPRTGVTDRDEEGGYYDQWYGYTLDPASIPRWLKHATAELARWLASENRTAESDLLEYSALTVGPLSLVKDKESKKEVLPESVRVMVQPYGVVASVNGIGLTRLVRA